MNEITITSSPLFNIFVKEDYPELIMHTDATAIELSVDTIHVDVELTSLIDSVIYGIDGGTW